MNSVGGRFAAMFRTLAAVLFAVAAPAGATDQEGCLLCHRLDLRVASAGVEKSITVHDPPEGLHKALYCSDCHPDARNAPHAAPPGAAQCIGECHGGSDASAASHRRAAFAGFTESHRRVAPGGSTCKLCHSATDRKGDRSAKSERCEGCHRKEYVVAAAGPHGPFADTPRFCLDCHPAHPEGAASTTTAGASCTAPGCHSRTTPAMRSLVDHRNPHGKGREFAHALIFFLLAFSGWAAGRALSPPPGRDGDQT